MKSKEDLLNLLNFAKPIIYGPKSVPIPLRVVTFYSNPRVNPNRYKQFKIKKKNGGERVIHAPVKGLKALQKILNLIFNVIFQPHTSAYGFVEGRSIVGNAREHASSHYVFNIDLKDFFPSIDQARVWKCFHLEPFNLNPENGRQELANLLAALCCTEMEVERLNHEGKWQETKRNVLPQGAPTSPILTNVVCQRLDHLLTGVAKRFGLKYSRYADDITFSSMHNVYQKDGEFIRELYRVIQNQNFQVKESKIRLHKRGYRQMVTGLVVNDKANVQKKYIKELRMWLYLWERYGLERANESFLNDYTKNKPDARNKQLGFPPVIEGKLNYLRMVSGEDNETYKKLNNRFRTLMNAKEGWQPNRNQRLNNVLNILFTKGLHDAMGIYQKSK